MLQNTEGKTKFLGSIFFTQNSLESGPGFCVRVLDFLALYLKQTSLNCTQTGEPLQKKQERVGL